MLPGHLLEHLKKLDFKKEQRQLNIEILLVLCILFQVYYIFNYWNQLPDIIATHFNLLGEPDGYGSKNILLLFPIISIFIYGLMTLVTRFPQFINVPWRLTEENLERQIKLVWHLLLFLKSEIILMMTFFCYQSIQIAIGNAQTLGNSPLLFVGAILVTIIWYFSKGYTLR